MAYIKYKELTKYFNFNEELDITTLPEYVTDYLSKTEQIYAAYKTGRDKAIFTDRCMILFDVTTFLCLTKKIHIIPYHSISTGTILFRGKSASIILSLDSGYQIKLDFIKLDSKSKTRLRLLYCIITEKIKTKNR